MVGTMPKTALLLVQHGIVVGEFESYTAIGHHYGILITGGGVIVFNGEPRVPSYIMKGQKESAQSNGFTPDEAIRDWCRSYMPKRLPAGHHIYRFLV